MVMPALYHFKFARCLPDLPDEQELCTTLVRLTKQDTKCLLMPADALVYNLQMSWL